VLLLTVLRNGVFPVSEMECLTLFIRFATFTNFSIIFSLVLYFFLPFLLLSFTNGSTSRTPTHRSFSWAPEMVNVQAKFHLRIWHKSHQPDTFLCVFLATECVGLNMMKHKFRYHVGLYMMKHKFRYHVGLYIPSPYRAFPSLHRLFVIKSASSFFKSPSYFLDFAD
jgi:hypothetical protein